MTLKILPKLTKDYVLSKVSQEEIFSYYLSPYNITVQTDGLFSSPFREDKNPSTGFRYQFNGRLRMRDFGGDFHGDCFDLVKRVCYTKTFPETLERIARDFGIHKYEYRNTAKTSPLKKEAIPIIQKKRTVIRVKARAFDNRDLKYWEQYNITKDILEQFRVYAVKFAWVENKMTGRLELYYRHNYGDPCFAYYYGKDKDGIEMFKLYRPYAINKKMKFRQNCSVLQGGLQIKRAEVGFVTKSQKDIMCMRSFGINAVAPSSESAYLDDEELELVNGNYNSIYILYDNDLQGLRFTNKFKKKYGFMPLLFHKLFLPNEFLDVRVKDFSDYVKLHGIKNTVKLIEYVERRIGKSIRY